MTPRKMIRLLKKNGFIEVPGGKGSHRRLFNPETKTTIVVPHHCKDLKKGTELAILKQAGLK